MCKFHYPRSRMFLAGQPLQVTIGYTLGQYRVCAQDTKTTSNTYVDWATNVINIGSYDNYSYLTRHGTNNVGYGSTYKACYV